MLYQCYNMEPLEDYVIALIREIMLKYEPMNKMIMGL